MKSVLAVVSAFLENRTSRSNLKALMRLIVILVGLVCIYSVLFHVLMEREGQKHSWVTGFYWTLTVMTTLGFGDIIFISDWGRVFSMVVLVSGVMFMLVLLPFTFIEFFYAPWMRAQASARAPRELPAETRRHVILTRYGPVTSVLIPMLAKYHYPYVVLVPTAAEALELYELGIRVAVGDLDDPETYRRLRVYQAAMVVTTRTDVINTNVTFTVREIAERVPIMASADSEATRGVLELAGASRVLRLGEMMGQALARRVIGNDAVAHVIGDLDGLLIAEACATGTPMVGQTLAESRLRPQTGVNVIGLWERGRLTLAGPETRIEPNSVLVLAGTREQIDRYNELLCIYHVTSAPTVVIGSGKVGRATGRALTERDLTWRVVEKVAGRVEDPAKAVIGDASQIGVLHQAGIQEAASVIVTTHDDDTNIYLTILCRRLRSDLRIISRCTLERNVATLHRAGADLVLSYASMGANMIFNSLRGSDTLLMAEGMSVFPVRVPEALGGRTLAESAVRSRTGCTIIAVEAAGRRTINPPADFPLPPEGEMVLVGTIEAEDQYLKTFQPDGDSGRGRKRRSKRAADAAILGGSPM